MSKKLAVAYIRVSTDHQDLGPDAQAESIREWAEKRGVEVVAEFREVVSGKTEIKDRPQMTAALAAIGALDADFLLVAKRDRLARSVVQCGIAEQLVKMMGARLIGVDDPNGDNDGPEAELMRVILDAFAAFERARLAIRVKEALAIKRGRGELIGQLSYGYRLAADEKTLVPDEVEHPNVLKILKWHRDGHGLRAICRKCADDKIFSRAGLVFEPQQIKRIIHREVAK